MASTKGKIVRLLAGFVLERGTVVSVQGIGNFQRVQVQCDAKPFAAGAKVQLLLRSDDMRTYTPIPSASGMTLLGWKHGSGPGTQWLEAVQPGDELRFVGPQRSLEPGAGPLVVVGDETSVAVAAAFALEKSRSVHAVIQSDAASDVREAAASVGLSRIDVVMRADVAATASAVRTQLSSTVDAVVALTGGSELIVSVRDALRGAGLRRIKTKAHWIRGRAGLD